MTITATQPAIPLTTPERATTRHLHRGFFALMGLLPGRLATTARTAYFDFRFTSGTPWPYDTCAYEAAKRTELVAAVPPDAQLILEVGAADGHNLSDLADRAPSATVVGIDLSKKACDLARRRVSGRASITVEQADLPGAAARLPRLLGSVDVLVVAEVLYYLGGLRATAAQLAPVPSLLAPSGRVVLLHGSADAQLLHARAARCLGLRITGESHHTADGRDFVISVLERMETPRTSSPSGAVPSVVWSTPGRA